MASAQAAESLPSRRAYRMHLLFCRGDFEKCLDLIEECAADGHGSQAYFSVFVKAMILRQQGKVSESLKTLEHAVRLDPENPQNLKQVGRSLYLLGRHNIAIDVYNEAQKSDGQDWELLHDKGLCYLCLKQLDQAEAMFKESLEAEAQDRTYLQLATVYTMQGRLDDAIATYITALAQSPDNPELLTQLGLLYLRTSQSDLALQSLTKSFEAQPATAKTILALGSILQDRQDMDGALLKYRAAALTNPNSAQVWNNIGMCFFGKQRYIAAIACLKRALYLAPFEWITCYNLGLVHLNTAQYASAFHHFSSAINLKPSFSYTYMYLGVTLARLMDFDNACHAYQKAIQQDPDEAVFHLNYAVTLHNTGKMDGAREEYAKFRTLYESMDEKDKNADPEVAEQATTLMSLLA